MPYLLVLRGKRFFPVSLLVSTCIVRSTIGTINSLKQLRLQSSVSSLHLRQERSAPKYVYRPSHESPPSSLRYYGVSL